MAMQLIPNFARTYDRFHMRMISIGSYVMGT